MSAALCLHMLCIHCLPDAVNITLVCCEHSWLGLLQQAPFEHKTTCKVNKLFAEYKMSANVLSHHWDFVSCSPECTGCRTYHAKSSSHLMVVLPGKCTKPAFTAENKRRRRSQHSPFHGQFLIPGNHLYHVTQIAGSHYIRLWRCKRIQWLSLTLTVALMAHLTHTEMLSLLWHSMSFADTHNVPTCSTWITTSKYRHPPHRVSSHSISQNYIFQMNFSYIGFASQGLPGVALFTAL